VLSERLSSRAFTDTDPIGGANSPALRVVGRLDASSGCALPPGDHAVLHAIGLPHVVKVAADRHVRTSTSRLVVSSQTAEAMENSPTTR
jgi:hypothetical protein